MRRWIGWIVFATIFFVAAIAGLSWYLAKDKYVIMGDYTVKKDTLRRSALGQGKVESFQPPAALGFTLAGRLKSVNVVEGQEVKKGAELASLDSLPFELEAAAARAVLFEQQQNANKLLKDAAPEEIKQLEEKLERARLDVKTATVKLKILEEPPPAEPNPAWQLADQALEIERLRQTINESVYAQNKLLEPPSELDLQAGQAKVNAAQTEYDSAKRKLEWASKKKDSFGALREDQMMDVEAHEQRQLRALEVAKAEFERLKKGPSKNDLEAANARVAAAKTAFDLAVNLRNRMVQPPSPIRPPAWQIELARQDLTRAQSSEREAALALALRKAFPRPEDKAAAEAAVERARKATEEAESRIKEAVLRAPYDGVIVGRHYEPGSSPSPYVPVISMMDVQNLRVRAEIPAKWAAQVQAGQTVKLDANDKLTMGGKVTRIANVIGPKQLFSQDPSDSKGGEVVTALIDLEEIKGDADKAFRNALRPGLRLDVKVDLGTTPDVLCVPITFLKVVNNEFIVQKGNSKHLDNIRVETGVRDGNLVEIKSGIKEGDLIVKALDAK